MKNLLTFFSVVVISLSINAQEQKVEIVPDSLFRNHPTTTTNAILACNYFSCGVEIQQVSADYFLPFKLYEFPSKKENWFDIQSVYNTIQAKVPSVSITSNVNLNQTPNIRMRGDENTVVIVDGVRYDASILNTLNPENIESVKVSHNPAASLYFLNR